MQNKSGRAKELRLSPSSALLAVPQRHQCFVVLILCLIAMSASPGCATKRDNFVTQSEDGIVYAHRPGTVGRFRVVAVLPKVELRSATIEWSIDEMPGIEFARVGAIFYKDGISIVPHEISRPAKVDPQLKRVRFGGSVMHASTMNVISSIDVEEAYWITQSVPNPDDPLAPTFVPAYVLSAFPDTRDETGATVWRFTIEIPDGVDVVVADEVQFMILGNTRPSRWQF